MKRTLSLWGLFLLLTAGLAFSGCSGGSDKGPNISVLLTHHIDANVLPIDGNPSPSFIASVTVLNQGQPVTDAAVTLILPDFGPVTLANLA